MRSRWRLVLRLFLLLIFSLGCVSITGCTAPTFENNLRTIVQPHRFNLVDWQIRNLYQDIKGNLTERQSDFTLDSRPVMLYFSDIAQLHDLNEENIRQVESQIAALKPVAEETIARQINEILAEQGIYHPFGDSCFKGIFPPVNFKLEKPLYLLVVSPRDRIQKVRSIVIKPEIKTPQIEEMESSIAESGVSALVVELGGLGASYPTFVANDADLRFTIDTAVEEWLHQYLAFKPLGFRYVLDLLGISRDEAIPTINETVVGIAGQELGTLVYEKYYAPYQVYPEEKAPVTPGIDFNAAMRDIRRKVDLFLAEGRVEQAEQYMEEQRQYLADNGHYIRKLNQAYFAFYGTYAYSPTSIDPIGNEVRVVRNNSLSVKHFLAAVSLLNNREDLRAAVSRYR